MVNIELERVPCPPEDNVLLKCSNTRAFIGLEEVGDGRGGDLFVASDCVSWIDAAGNGFALVYPTIALHGTCRDLTAFPHHCIYLMIDGKLPCVGRAVQTTTEEESNEDDGGEEEGSEADFTEVRFVPSPDQGPSLEELYAALSRGQSLNPDQNDDNSDDSEDGAEYDCEEECEDDDNQNGHQFDDNDEGHMEH